VQVLDAFFQALAQALVNRRGQCQEVLLGLAQRRFGLRAAAVPRFRGACDFFEVALQHRSVGRRDQALAGAPTGDEQGRGGAEQRHQGEAH
jgi:hypothetical protein